MILSYLVVAGVGVIFYPKEIVSTIFLLIFSGKFRYNSPTALYPLLFFPFKGEFPVSLEVKFTVVFYFMKKFHTDFQNSILNEK